MTKKLALVVVALASFAVGAFLPAEPASAAGVVQWNIDGAFLSQGVSRNSQADEFSNYLTFMPPTFGTLNEVCEPQVLRIAANTDYEAAYAMVYNGGAARPDCGNTSDTQYYNAVFYPENLSFVDVDFWRFSTSPDSAPGRALLCVKVAFIFSISTGCSAHLSPYSSLPSANETQLAETIWVGSAYGSDGPRTYLAGDYNARSWRTALDTFYSQYWETNARTSKRWTIKSTYGCDSNNSGGRGIDYIFGNKSGNPSSGLGLVAVDTGSKSDHCLVMRAFD
ncbi:MAG TPA: endonuclease/exonuclease/phosphatase family protein [Acidimicrobiales bacterium]|nr:endonuclease/exonuclease/phosphatase family protein [Acidimicrobiales bacterium]